MTDYYQILGVPQQASTQEVHDAYLSLSKELDPDHPSRLKNRADWVQASHRLREVNRAFAVLGDQPRRLEYDRRLDEGNSKIIPPLPPPPGPIPDGPTVSDLGPRGVHGFVNAPAVSRLPIAVSYLGPRGVHGFLKFFCVILTAIIPPLALFVFLREWLALLGAGGLTTEEVHWFAEMLIITQLLRCAFVIYGFMVGVEILDGSDRGRFLAKRFLLQSGFGMVLLQIWMWKGFMSFDGRPGIHLGPVTEAEFSGALAVGFFSLLWWAYFRESARVRNTYGPEYHGAVGLDFRTYRERRINELRGKEICVVCGYDLRATPHCCPECGTHVIIVPIPQPPPR